MRVTVRRVVGVPVVGVRMLMTGGRVVRMLMIVRMRMIDRIIVSM